MWAIGTSSGSTLPSPHVSWDGLVGWMLVILFKAAGWYLEQTQINQQLSQ